MSDKLLAVFDLDHTLLRINSQYFFAERFFEERSALAATIFTTLTAGLRGKLLSKCVRGDIRRATSLRLFGAFSQRTLNIGAEKVFSACSDEEIFNPGVLKLFQHLCGDDRFHVIIASATPDFIAQVFARRLRVAALSSVYSRGRLLFDMTGKKLEQVAAIKGVKPHVFISDNKEDINTIFPHYIIVADGNMYLRRDDVEMFVCSSN